MVKNYIKVMFQMTKTVLQKTKTISEMLKKIEATVKAIADPKRRGIVVNWLFQFCGYLEFEKRFNPAWYKKYHPGDIIDVDFGFNLGSELGGVHFAVVIEDNSRKDANVMVVPLSSYRSKDEVKQSHVDLGVLPELNSYRRSQKHNTGTRALVNQMRPISKIRIYYPKKRHDSLCQLSNEQLQLIYDKIQERYCSKFPEDRLKENRR
jgi:mRNA interferase MazF